MNEFMTWFGGTTWGFIDALATSLTLGLVVYNWHITYRQSRSVEIVLRNQNENFTLTTITRKYITRAEILGVLGQFQKDSTKRYNIKYLSNPNFYSSVMDAQNDKSDQIIIQMDKEEFGYFEVNK